MVAEVLADTSSVVGGGRWPRLRSQLVLARCGLGLYGEWASHGIPALSRDSLGLRLLFVVKETRQ
jgi:hypothetical protein